MLQDLKTTFDTLMTLAETLVLPYPEHNQLLRVAGLVSDQISLLETHYAAQDNEQAREELEAAVA